MGENLGEAPAISLSPQTATALRGPAVPQGGGGLDPAGSLQSVPHLTPAAFCKSCTESVTLFWGSSRLLGTRGGCRAAETNSSNPAKRPVKASHLQHTNPPFRRAFRLAEGRSITGSSTPISASNKADGNELGAIPH